MIVTPKFKEKYVRRFRKLLERLPLRKQVEIQLTTEMRAEGVKVTMRTVRNWVANSPS